MAQTEEEMMDEVGGVAAEIFPDADGADLRDIACKLWDLGYRKNAKLDTANAPERVIFRKFPHDGAVIALFPDQYNERTGYIGSYMELGQHSDTMPDFGDTVAANPVEYRDLMNELIRQGYHNLKVVKRFGKLGRK